MIATPKRLVRLANDEPNETIDFVEYYRDSNGKELRYTIGHFVWNKHEPCWSLYFAGDRFTKINAEDIVPIWEALKGSYRVLDRWKEACTDEI